MVRLGNNGHAHALRMRNQFSVDHAVVCQRGSFIIQHHNELRDLEA